MIKRLDKKGISELLNISSRSVERYDKNRQLESKLNKIGYTLKEIEIVKRKEYYVIQQKDLILTDAEYKQLYNNICRFTYSTNKYLNFSKYLEIRTQLSNENDAISKKDIAILSGVSSRTIAKWDSTLQDKEILKKNGYVYFYITADTKQVIKCSKEEYDSFWKNSFLLKAFKDLQSKYLNGQITLNELQLATSEATTIASMIFNKYYYRTKKYKIDKDNKLYIDTTQLINKVYKDKIHIEPKIKE